MISCKCSMVDKMARVIHVSQEKESAHGNTCMPIYILFSFFLPCHAIMIASNIRFGNADHQIHPVILIVQHAFTIRIRILHRKRNSGGWIFKDHWSKKKIWDIPSPNQATGIFQGLKTPRCAGNTNTNSKNQWLMSRSWNPFDV